MARWIIFAIVIVALLISGALLAGAFGLGDKNLIMVERQYSEETAGLKLTTFRDEIPEIFLFRVDRSEQSRFSRAKIPYTVLQQNFKPSAEHWFIHSEKVCSPCFTNTVKSFARKIIWQSDHQYLVEADVKNIKQILNNVSYAEWRVYAYGLEIKDRKVLSVAPAPSTK